MENHSETMDSKSAWRNWVNAIRLMRIPFSIFLMPIYWFALVGSEVDVAKAILVFITIHFFLYPSSNGYNSWYDRDEGSIGGLKNPPKVTRELWYLVLLFDFLSLLLAMSVNFLFALMIFIYMLMSKAYSWDKTRLKRFPIFGALTVVVFQGFWTFMMVKSGVSKNPIATSENYLLAAVSSLFLLGSYPLTQIYQHDEDKRHGDKSLSILLGVRGTFIFSSLAFLLASALIIYVFFTSRNLSFIVVYLIAMLPVNIFFLKWFNDFRKGLSVITFERTMRMNVVSSLLLSAAFIVMLLLK